LQFNIIDYAILAFFALSLLVGLYRGAVATALNLVAVGVALLVSRLCYPLVSDWIAGHETWMNYLVYFSEGSSHITTEMMELARTDIATLSQDQILQVIASANFTPPFDAYLESNALGLVYAGSYNTLFDYFNQTVADASLNTISFVLLFFFTYVVASLLVTLVNRVFNFPVLRALDGIAGGVLGIGRGFVLMMVLVTLVPLAVNMLQIDLITDMVNQSRLLRFFYPDNWFFGWIRSVL
jgi:uncharacterized membrane protein required for colicin V production